MSARVASDGTGGARRYLLTGVTGFLGKVILEDLMRRREALRIERVTVLIRAQGRRSAQDRFERDVAPAACFDALPADWTTCIDVVEGDLATPGCGLDPASHERLEAELTHIVHGAASVDFDLPIAEAATANATGALQVLELARNCPRLERMVSVSTAYVTPHPGGAQPFPVHEELAPLPAPAEGIYRSIVEGHANEAELLSASGHPNTYTFTKCLAEHLLVERRGRVPLSIVRPSIISASVARPVPGWIDSGAAFVGFVSLIGAGYLHTVCGGPESRADIVPVDWVATRVVDASVESAPPDEVTIHHSVAGLSRNPSIRECRDRIVEFFRSHPVDRRPWVRFIGPPTLRFKLLDLIYTRLPVLAGMLVSQRARRGGRRLLGRMTQVNAIFPYFTQRTFDFRTKTPCAEADYEASAYITNVCAGVHRQLLRGDPEAVPIAGRQHPGNGGDLRWALRQPHGTMLLRFAALVVAKALRRCASVVTVDAPSFDRALRATPDDTPRVLAPSHRSYMDFVLCSYLCFARPELGIAIPHVAASVEFSRIPVLGRMLRSLGAFYLERGVGREQKELTRQVHQLVHDQATIEFFVEGRRSRARRFLPPKRGLLRSIQSTGQSCTLLPIAFTYDRMPEERTFISELSGAPRPRMQLRGLLGWTWRMLRGQIDLGRIHIACGEPLRLDLESDVYEVSRKLMAGLQEATVATEFHLRSFAAGAARGGVDPDVDVGWLRDAIRARGGRVLKSPIRPEVELDPRIAASMRYQFAHWFHTEARATLGELPALEHHLAENDFRGDPGLALATPASALEPVLRALFEPVCNDYARVADALGPPQLDLEVASAREVVVAHPEVQLANAEAAFDDLVRRRILVPADTAGEFAWGPRALDVVKLRTLYRWPDGDGEGDGEGVDA